VYSFLKFAQLSKLSFVLSVLKRRKKLFCAERIGREKVSSVDGVLTASTVRPAPSPRHPKVEE
jgi:hypothetical protein